MANNYRAVVVLNPTLGDEGLTALTDSIKAKIESAATIDSLDVIGMKELAYEINDQRSGYYVQINFTAEGDFPSEFERVLNITDGVLRYLVVRIGE
ncbi:MAG: 30S ribosomal protein S6 [Clostridiales bacterium]|jgi:small subunit ribosomal protein S6|nr:30S ribosomal protein S6 [Clostridiales bacterium]